MDNLAHALVGAVLGEAGLRRRTGLATPCLVIAANLPDIDVLGPLLFGAPLDFRRGWTHGPLGLVLLPPLLALLLWSFDRRQARRGTRPAARDPVHFGWLLALAWIGALTHPLLDWLNTYGVRPLMPFSRQWFYGDTLFVIDPLLWAVLLMGVLLARRRRARGKASPALPATIAIASALGYIGLMSAAGRIAERAAVRDLATQGRRTPELVLASPLPANPFKRHIIYRLDGSYGFGDVDFTPKPSVSWLPERAEIGLDHPAVVRASRLGELPGYLAWSRLPYAELGQDEKGAWVKLHDARYRRVYQEAGLVAAVRLPSN